MDETYVINQMKEDTCFVSMDFYKDIKKAKVINEDTSQNIAQDYVLPDFSNIHRGYAKPSEYASIKSKVKSQEQIIRTTIERFAIPEILFNPSDIGVMQMGIPEAIMHSISKCPEEYQLHLLRNILLIGGNFLFPNIQKRLEYELRTIAPDDLEVHTTLPDNPVTYACSGGVDWSSSADIKKKWVTLQEYQEHGKNICLEKFSDI